jgi:hypothetical protein
MSDSSNFQIPEMKQALTGDMLIGLKPAAPKSRSYRISIAPTNKNIFVGGDQCIFELPVGRRGTWLDQSQSYLKFSVQCSATAATAGTPNTSGVFIENTAYSFIQRIDIYNSSNLLETINEYGQLANFLLDTSLTQSDKVGLSSMIGSNPYTLANSTANPYAQNTLNYCPVIAGDRSGLPIVAVLAGNGINTAVPYTFSLPLLSGIIGINSSKMLPVGKLHNPIHVELYWAANDDAIYYADAGAGALWQIVNVEFVACYVELQNDEIDNLNDDMPHYICSTTYRQSSAPLTAATNGEFTTLLPFRCSSLTAIYARFRPFVQSVQGAYGTAAYRKSASINPNFGSYYFRIANSIVPNKPVYLINNVSVGNGAEGYAELLKSFHALSSTIGNSSLTYNNYNVAASATLGWAVNYLPSSKAVGNTIDTCGNAFAIGIELQTFSNRNDTILSGVSTQNNQVYFTAMVYTGLTAGGGRNYNYSCDFFAQMDMVLTLENGILSARY